MKVPWSRPGTFLHGRAVTYDDEPELSPQLEQRLATYTALTEQLWQALPSSERVRLMAACCKVCGDIGPRCGCGG